VTVVALWAHPRAVSTAFVRMMMERGDVTVVHEPMVLLTDHGEARLPAPDGGESVVRSPGELFRSLAELGRQGPVFFKDTLEYRYAHLFDHPEDVAAFRHTFIVRDPARAIASHHAVKPEVTCAEIGYEHQWQLFTHLWRTTGERPLVLTAESLLADPPAAVRAYCEHTGLEYRPEALSWQPGERTEWEQNRRWHLDAIASSGFHAPDKEFTANVRDDPRLRAFHAHHLPYYERLVEHAPTTA
ncbi:hypothetical protein N566_01585, partial [Streptomycetaceae bacterium MP113-05]